MSWRRRCVVDFGSNKVQKPIALLVRYAILAMRALARVVAKEACAEAVAVQLEAA